jgi:exo-beta-1,3-glucanase (GH17 family)
MRAVVAVLLFVTAAHAGLWGLFQHKQPAPDFRGVLPSLSYTPFEPGHVVDSTLDPERIRADLKRLSTVTRAIRSYSSTEGNELVPQIAAEFGLKVMVGAWINKDPDHNQREIESAIALAKRNSNVNGIVVGNETVFRADQKVEDLIELIKRVKKSVNVPVTTGEIWNIWRDNPNWPLRRFHRAHVLPYWENFTDKQAGRSGVAMFQLLRDQFPGKAHRHRRIRLAERRLQSAQRRAGPFEQASVLRNFVTRAEAIGMDYNIVEAIDQPWKFFEGGVGPYWGILDASREPKFPWTGPIVNENYWKLARSRCLVGILMSLPILRIDRPTIMQALVLSTAANGVGAWVSTVFAYWTGHYFVLGSAFALTLGLTLLVPLDPDRDGADRRDRSGRLRPRPAPADHQERAAGARHHRRERRLPESVDPHPRLFRTGRDAEGDAGCGLKARLSELRMRLHHQQHARSGVLAGRSRTTAARSASASSSSMPRRCRASRPARCASPWTAPRPMPRSSASSTPTMSCIRTG